MGLLLNKLILIATDALAMSAVRKTPDSQMNPFLVASERLQGQTDWRCSR